MSLVHLNFQSYYLEGNTDVAVIFPDDPIWSPETAGLPKQYYASGKKYKVLWLLHGTYGDYTDWLRKSRIELYATELDLIVVMPTGLNANYVNWQGFALGYRMWDYLTEELMPLIQGWFPASAKKEDNFIAGLSMGGSGALQYAVGHPDLFAGAAVLSCCAADYTHLRDSDAQPVWGPRLQNMVQDAGGTDAFLNSPSNVWDRLQAWDCLPDRPRLYCAIGKNDFLYQEYLHFKQHMQDLGIDAQFEEYDNFEHEWRFWDLSIQKALAFFGFSL